MDSGVNRVVHACSVLISVLTAEWGSEYKYNIGSIFWVLLVIWHLYIPCSHDFVGGFLQHSTEDLESYGVS